MAESPGRAAAPSRRVVLARSWRAAGIVALAAALVANVYKHVAGDYFAFFDTFGYFSQQSNVLALAVLVVALVRTGRPRPDWLEYARAGVVVYLVIVTAVYWVLLGGFEPSAPVMWSTAIMHGGSCAFMLADWLLEGPRRPHPLARVWVVTLYPAAWIAVALVRGATDGWVPYPFLDPAGGYASVAAIVGGLMVVGVAMCGGLFRLTRWRPVDDAAAGEPR